MHKVVNDRIFETETGKEVMWRGAGGSYLFHAGANYQQAWEAHATDMQKMGLNTMRLAFAFADSTPNPSTGTPSADILDFTKLDWVLSFLDQYGIKGILDLHNWIDMAGDFGSQKLINDWIQIAQHYVGDARVAAYELFNEPSSTEWSPNVTTKEGVIQAYKQLTDAIRQYDPDHIVIWQSKNYTPTNLQDYASQIPQNVVFTHHEWWTNNVQEITLFGPVVLSQMVIDYPVIMRRLLNRPFWLGEFGTSGGGNKPFDPTNPEDQICEQLLYRAEEQVEGWNLWQGTMVATKPLYPQELFPLKIFNQDLIRKPLTFTNIVDYITAMHGVDILTPAKVEMWHNGDYITLKPGIIVRYLRTQVQADKSSKVMEDTTIRITQPLTLTNIEGTTDYPGDWNLCVYLVTFPSIPLWKVALLLLGVTTTGLVIASKIGGEK
jgi:hypothetical protein